MKQQKSMIVPSPFWDEVKATKKDKQDYKRKTGLNLEIDKFIFPNEKYFQLIEKILIK